MLNKTTSKFSKEALELLERKVSLILDSAINITGRFKRIRAFEIEQVKIRKEKIMDILH